MAEKKRLLVIEPYLGGSHQAFLQGLMTSVSAGCTLLSLPARSWKMRMQLSAPWFAAQVRNLPEASRWFEAVLCSTFVDVAVLRALLTQLPGWNLNARFCTYFHENQFAYPGQYPDSAIRQFQYINFNSALASDRLAFNSAYNRDSFLNGCSQYLQKSQDMRVSDLVAEISGKSMVLPPGIDYTPIDSAPAGNRSDVPVIVWNHRWEHDKNPREFFAVLRSLKKRGLSFNLILLGQSFSTEPECFREAKVVFADRILHFGYADSRAEYGVLLKKGDIVVSTALHEFFGISVLEAVRAGCRPLLPRRLSYPELFPETFLYRDGELERCLESVLRETEQGLMPDVASACTEPYNWQQLAGHYRDWLFR